MLTMKPRAIAVGLMGLASLVPLGAAAQGVRLPGAQRPQLSAPVAAPSNTQRQADFIVAVVNAEPVTNNEVRARMARVLRQIQQSGGAQPPLDLLAAEVMEQLIVEKAQMQLAKEGGITVDELAIDQAAQTIARRNEVSMEEMLRRLSAEGVSREQFRLELRRQLTLQRLREREVDARVRVSEPEIDQFLREQSPQGADLARTELNIAQVLIAVPEDASEAQVAAAQARAQGVADKARANGDFAALAREFSDAPGATNSGGQMGLRAADRYPELFVSAVASLPVGGVAGPVRSGAGFHVLKLIEKSRASLPATVVQSRARHILLRTSAQRLCHLRKIDLQHIGFDDLQLRMLAQALRQVAVQLDHGEPPQPLDQRLRQRRQPRPDFNHGLARLRRNGAHDPIDDGRIGQEMLAEALFWNVLHWGGSRYST